jgi:hypothetical protein
MDKRKASFLKIAGNILLWLGVGVWAVYGVLRFGLGWDITARQCLPYHLAGVVPGVILKRHDFFWGIVKGLFP